jgi:hypothetical protein
MVYAEFEYRNEIKMGFMSWNKPYGRTGLPVNKHVYNLTMTSNETQKTQETKTRGIIS